MIRPTASLFIGLVVSLLSTTMGWAEPASPVLLFERPSHFTAPDGTDVLVAAGTYRVEQSAEAQLRLIADPLQPAFEITAAAMTHEETVAAPLALLIAEEGQTDEVHLVLLRPDGQGLDATGSLSGIRSRATSRTLTAAQLHSSLVQSTGLFSGTDSQPSVLYGIAPTGALKWYRHNGAPTGAGLNSPGAWTGPTEVGSGWQDFIQVVPGGGTVLYGIARDGTLKWYSHNDAMNGTPAWQGAKNVGTGWQNFKQVFSGSEGILYAIAQDGTLKWYHHTGYRDGAATWDGPKTVGSGWQNFKTVFGMGDGVIYAIAGDGKLKWYKHTGFRDGTVAWEGPKDVGTGWQNFKQVFGAGNGLIYAIANDGILKWYKHLGYRDGTFAWEGAKDIGTGWQGFPTVVALLPPLPTAAAAATIAPPETVVTSGSGNWVTWNYLAMHHPEIVAQALADVQTNTQPRTSIVGLASDVELNAMLKTDWTAEVSRLATMGKASGPQAGITPRGLPGGLSLTDQVTAVPQQSPFSPILKTLPSASDQVTAIPSGKTTLPSAYQLIDLNLPPRNLGSVWAGQSAFAYVFITAPADGYIEGRFNLNATNRHFRIVNAKAYTGEVVNGIPSVSLTIPGGQYQDVVVDPANPPSQISKAGFVAILAKKGQLIAFTVAFEPVGLGMTPVGNNEATLELSGATSTEINILSPNAPVVTWRRMASILARFEGINFGVLGAMSDSAITVFYDGTPCGRLIPVPASVTFHNAEQQARSISVTAELSHPLHMQGFTVSLAPGERKQVPIPIQIDSCPTQGVEYMGRLNYAYADVVRHAEFGVTLYPKLLHWYKDSADVGSCRYSWDIYAQPDGTTRFAYSLRNTNLVSEMQLDLRFLLLGVNIGRGVLSDGQNTVHTKFGGYTTHSSFVQDNYPRLFSERAQAGLRCHTPGF